MTLTAQTMRARLHVPSPELGACIFLAVERYTRGLQLSEAQRFNYYPASPFPTISWIFEGMLMMGQDLHEAPEPAIMDPLPRVVFSGPYRRPCASWSPGAVHALSVSFHPDALSRLLGIRIEDHLDSILPLQDVASGIVADALFRVACDDRHGSFQSLETVLRPLWRGMHPTSGIPDIRGWLSSLAVRTAFSRPGTGLRQLQRRVKDWTGQSYRDLRLYARVEEVMAQVAALPGNDPLDLAALAADTGFADQSHLGRAVRRVTGVPPKRLNELIRTEESFWLYRLLKGHLQVQSQDTWSPCP